MKGRDKPAGRTFFLFRYLRAKGVLWWFQILLVAPYLDDPIWLSMFFKLHSSNLT